MSSGVAYREVSDGNDDSAKLSRALFSPQGHGAEQALAQFDRREVPAGTRFHYVGAETETLGVAVARATGSTLAKLLETRVWQPMDAEADATWAVDSRGLETAYCCVSAVLRDWARVGLMLAHDGAWNGRQIVPRNWVIDMTSVAAPQFAPGAATRANGYGYQTWLLPGPGRQFALLGTLGQGVYIDPAAKLVMVHTAAREKPSGDPAIAELMALWRALPR
jgi:CubicO group peptidase (beta-lactamase class C family)